MLVLRAEFAQIFAEHFRLKNRRALDELVQARRLPIERDDVFLANSPEAETCGPAGCPTPDVCPRSTRPRT